VSVTYARGFTAAGVTAGVKPSGQPDLGLLVGRPGPTAAGVFTTNRLQAAPVRLSRARLEAGRASAVVVNSGQANAATGEAGDEAARRLADAAASSLGLDIDAMLTASTGVIGEPLHLDELLRAVPLAVESLSPEGGDAFARAIMTTDTTRKQASAEAGELRVGGCAKGVGMVAPNLATMLAFVTTDASVSPEDLDALTRSRIAPAFEAITIDGCASTNDTVLVFASGAAGGVRGERGVAAWASLGDALEEVATSLARQLIADGEGVTHVMLVAVEGAPDDGSARRVARAIADSPLVKTAVFGSDPNPGRVVQAVGAAGIDVDASAIDAWIGNAQVVTAGVIPPAYFSGGAIREAAMIGMKEPEVRFRVRIGDGPGSSRILGGDLSYEYVRINGEYTT
jgi:glutamate N-acetyltransferase/amino-acid N-acetyltransferase